eukprot:scaffold101682_cov19-Tisochrysis_lutea.AAC.2
MKFTGPQNRPQHLTEGWSFCVQGKEGWQALVRCAGGQVRCNGGPSEHGHPSVHILPNRNRRRGHGC